MTIPPIVLKPMHTHQFCVHITRTSLIPSLSFISALLFALLYSAQAFSQTPETGPRYKILHIMSYHSPWRWTDDQLAGFKEGLGVANVEYKVFQMNTKQNSTDGAKLRKAKQAKLLIESWKPDLVYTTDDDAQQWVAKDYINSETPFIFSGVNKAPEVYGFVGSQNITGVVEHEHFVESVNLVQAISPSIKKLAVVFDDASMWPPIQERMKRGLKNLPNIELIAWDTIHTYAQYQKKIHEYQKTADAIALIGIFNFKDENQHNVPYQTVLQWTATHSQIPDIGFWIDRVHYGTLGAVTVSGREQGLAAGQMARDILVNGESPSNIPFKATAKGVPVISLARAKKLDLKVKSSLLLSAQIIQKFEWDK